MLIKELKEWVDAMPPEAHVQVMLQECAKTHGYVHYRESEIKDGGWTELEGRYLRVMREHPDRRPAEVADRLLK